MLEAYIANLEKYEKGEIFGKWVDFPASEEEIRKALKDIGAKDESGVIITNYKYDLCEELPQILGNFVSLEDLSELAESFGNLCSFEQEKFYAILEYEGGSLDGVRDLLEVIENLDNYEFLPGVSNDKDLGYYWIEESGCYDLESMGDLARYLDHESFGRDVRIDQCGFYTSYGYVAAL